MKVRKSRQHTSLDLGVTHVFLGKTRVAWAQTHSSRYRFLGKHEWSLGSDTPRHCVGRVDSVNRPRILKPIQDGSMRFYMFSHEKPLVCEAFSAVDSNL